MQVGGGNPWSMSRQSLPCNSDEGEARHARHTWDVAYVVQAEQGGTTSFKRTADRQAADREAQHRMCFPPTRRFQTALSSHTGQTCQLRSVGLGPLAKHSLV